jgi:SAM-dependent methyltransferase
MKHDPNLTIYADPANYDRESGTFNPDGTILLDLALQAKGPVLELGCGTGRVTIPLAARGIDLTGLDLSSHLVDYAQDKARDLPIQWVCQDVRNFHLATRYPLIFTYGAVFNHLLTRADQEAMLSRVYQHLAPGGKFLVDVSFKHPNRMVDVAEEQAWYSFTDDQGRQITVSGTDRYDHGQQIWVQTSRQSWLEDGRTKRSQPVQLALRYLMPQEMETLLHYNGF